MITLKTTDPCVLSVNPLPVPLPDQATFEARYRAAQPTALQGYPFNSAQLEELAADPANYVIDLVIMGWGWSPYQVMSLRLSQNEDWSPNADQANIPIAPGVNFPGSPSYDPKDPPVGSISNSLNLADYPCFTVKPKPAPAPDFISLVGYPTGTMINGMPAYASAPKTDNSAIPPNGLYDLDPRGEFQKIVGMTMVGPTVIWGLVKPAGN